jgi:hypothetical protein
MSVTASCINKARTALAEESGRIATLTEKEIMQSDSDYPLRRIPESTYDWGMGENPRGIRMQITPPPQVEYESMLPTGNVSGNIQNPDIGQTGQTITTQIDAQGRTQLQAQLLHFGYDTFGRCLRGTAIETEPISIIDILQKYSWSTFIKALRSGLPRYGREHFAQELLRQVFRLSSGNYSMTSQIPISTGGNAFPAVPTGGLNIPALRRIGNRMRVHGYNKGSQTTSVNGEPLLEVYAGQDAIEFAIIDYKRQMGLSLKSHLWEDDERIGMVTTYGDIKFVVNPTPVRGYLVQTGTGPNTFEFREIQRARTRAGTEGVVEDDNPEYFKDTTVVGGAASRVCEMFHIIHPRAMERQAAGAIPNIDGGRPNKNAFNFEVVYMDDWRVAGKDCNKDRFVFQYRMLHAYAPYAENPELMTAGVFLASPPAVLMTDPIVLTTSPVLTNTTLAALGAPAADTCVLCADGTPLVQGEPAVPDCTTIFPANGVGVIQFDIVVYTVQDVVSGVTISAVRTGGNTGAATVAYATANGTAIAGTNYTAESGTLSWIDGEQGVKTFVVPIIQVSGDNGLNFTAGLSGVTGATLGSKTTATVTIVATT